jgi:hypothetical protein
MSDLNSVVVAIHNKTFSLEMRHMELVLNTHVHTTGQLTNIRRSDGAPELDGALREVARTKILHYCPLYINRPDPIAFLPDAADTTGTKKDSRDGTRGDTQDTTRLVEIEELKSAIRALLFVTKLSRVDAYKDKAAGWGATIKCASCPGCCGKKQEPPVQLSSDRKSELACLQELLKRLQDRHVDCAEALAKKASADAASDAIVNPDAPNVLQAMMKLEQANARAKTANKVALEAEKEKDVQA